MDCVGVELTFCELRAKEVVNASDGRKLGRITDLVFSADSGAVKGIVAPFTRRGLFGKGQDVFIPWRCIKKIGEDVILVEIGSADSSACVPDRPPCPPPIPCRPPAPPENCPPAPPDGDCGCNPINTCDPCDPCDPCRPSCDKRCEKCMLFDCEFRWKR